MNYTNHITDDLDAILAVRTATLKGLVLGAKDKTLTFQDRNYRDLGCFAALLAQKAGDYPEVTAAAEALRDHLQARDAAGPVLRVGFLPNYEQATGLSVYLPAGSRYYAPDVYRSLRFAQATGWDQLLDWLLGNW